MKLLPSAIFSFFWYSGVCEEFVENHLQQKKVLLIIVRKKEKDVTFNAGTVLVDFCSAVERWSLVVNRVVIFHSLKPLL